MRQYVIVTLKSSRLSGTYDLEIPTNTPAGKIVSDIQEIIEAYRSESVFTPGEYVLYCERLGRMLADRETFDEAGVWSGDILEMKGKDER